jgi:hypothetical protein
MTSPENETPQTYKQALASNGFKLPGYPEELIDYSLFPAAGAEVLGKMAAFGACAIVGEANTGKSRLLFEVAEKAEKVTDSRIMFIDANKDSKSADAVRRTHQSIIKFNEVFDRESYVMIDNIGVYTRRGEDDDFNAARRDILVDILGSNFGDDNVPALAVATQGRIIESTEEDIPIIVEAFMPQQRLDFKGAIELVEAVQLLGWHDIPPVKAEAIAFDLQQDDALTYKALMNAAYSKQNAAISEALKLEKDPKIDEAMMKPIGELTAAERERLGPKFMEIKLLGRIAAQYPEHFVRSFPIRNI